MGGEEEVDGIGGPLGEALRLIQEQEGAEGGEGEGEGEEEEAEEEEEEE